MEALIEALFETELGIIIFGVLMLAAVLIAFWQKSDN